MFFCPIIKLFQIAIRRKYSKIIFLDFDGVLCPYNDSWNDNKDKYGALFGPRNIENLKSIIDATGAEIVISSSWRGGISLWGLLKMWAKRKMPGKVVGVTPIINENKSSEIDKWLSHHICHKYVIVDDMDFHQFAMHHHRYLVICNGRKGLLEKNVQKVISIIGQ